MIAVPVTITAEIHRPIGTVFDFVVAENVLPKVLLGYGPLPPVIGTRILHGPWERPGADRIVFLKGGGTVHEQIESIDRPTAYRYRIDDFRMGLKYLASTGEGSWVFTPLGTDSTRVSWTYTFEALSPLTAPPLWIFANWPWRGYMGVCMAATRRQLEMPSKPREIER